MGDGICLHKMTDYMLIKKLNRTPFTCHTSVTTSKPASTTPEVTTAATTQSVVTTPSAVTTAKPATISTKSLTTAAPGI